MTLYRIMVTAALAVDFLSRRLVLALAASLLFGSLAYALPTEAPDHAMRRRASAGSDGQSSGSGGLIGPIPQSLITGDTEQSGGPTRDDGNTNGTSGHTDEKPGANITYILNQLKLQDEAQKLAYARALSAGPDVIVPIDGRTLSPGDIVFGRAPTNGSQGSNSTPLFTEERSQASPPFVSIDERDVFTFDYSNESKSLIPTLVLSPHFNRQYTQTFVWVGTVDESKIRPDIRWATEHQDITHDKIALAGLNGRQFTHVAIVLPVSEAGMLRWIHDYVGTLKSMFNTDDLSTVFRPEDNSRGAQFHREIMAVHNDPKNWKADPSNGRRYFDAEEAFLDLAIIHAKYYNGYPKSPGK